MQVTRLFTGPDGESHFADLEVRRESMRAVALSLAP